MSLPHSWALSNLLANAVRKNVNIRVSDILPKNFGTLMDNVMERVRERGRHRKRDTQRDKERERERGRKREKERERERESACASNIKISSDGRAVPNALCRNS